MFVRGQGRAIFCNLPYRGDYNEKEQKKPRTIYQRKRQEAKKKISQEKAAEDLGISSRTIQFIEAGTREPRISVAFGMADLYGCDIQDFRPEKGKEGEEEDVRTASTCEG